tara:strand:- start:1225 stop:1623 length:399 start_codon:yes stop_codon:yes gene_type:complete
MKQVAFGNMNTIYTNDGLVLPQRLDLRDGNEKVSVILNNLVNKWMLYLKDKSKFFEIYLKQWDDYSKILIIYLEDVINSLRYNETITLWGSLGRVKRLYLNDINDLIDMYTYWKLHNINEEIKLLQKQFSSI